MSVRHKEGQIAANTAVKLADFMGVSEHWTQVRAQLGLTIRVGDSTINSTTNEGLGADVSGVIVIDFGAGSKAAEELYLYNPDISAINIKVLCT